MEMHKRKRAEVLESDNIESTTIVCILYDFRKVKANLMKGVLSIEKLILLCLTNLSPPAKGLVSSKTLRNLSTVNLLEEKHLFYNGTIKHYACM